jgi:hypothetical protein
MKNDGPTYMMKLMFVFRDFLETLLKNSSKIKLVAFESC